jgi:predicted phage tail protein
MKAKWAVAFAISIILIGCESKHDKLQKEILQRREALTRHQDSVMKASQKEVEQLDRELQEVNREYAKMKREAQTAHDAGTATAEQLRAVTLMRMHRDSLKTRFDVLCAKIKYIRRRQSEQVLWNATPQVENKQHNSRQ